MLYINFSFIFFLVNKPIYVRWIWAPYGDVATYIANVFSNNFEFFWKVLNKFEEFWIILKNSEEFWIVPNISLHFYVDQNYHGYLWFRFLLFFGSLGSFNFIRKEKHTQIAIYIMSKVLSYAILLFFVRLVKYITWLQFSYYGKLTKMAHVQQNKQRWRMCRKIIKDGDQK